METLIVGAAAFAGGVIVVVLGSVIDHVRRKRRERQIQAELRDLAEQAKKVLIDGIRSGRGKPFGVESVNAKEFFDALDAADLPTPGCGCAECDARRLRQAEKQAGR